MKNLPPDFQDFTLSDGRKVPLEIHRERRNGFRMAVGKSAILVRLPLHLDDAGVQKANEFIQKNLEAWLQNHPDFLNRFTPKTYQNGDKIQVGDRIFTLQIVEDPTRRTHNAKLLAGRVIAIESAVSDSPRNRQEAISTLISRVVAHDFLPELTRRVLELNEIFFKKYNKIVKSVRLKNNATNWGSCSSSGNLNFSTRLLFAPPDVVDYVIIHELAHLIELNHSDRFWKLVADAMPNYREKEIWLEKNGKSLKY